MSDVGSSAPAEGDGVGARGFGGFRAGFLAVAPLLLGVAPFGFVAGATPVTHGMSWDVPVGFSTVVFAGASQLAAIDVLTGGGSVVVAVLAAWTINLRMVLYSASLAPHVSRQGAARRTAMAYLLTDQVYALSIVRWQEHDEPGAPGEHRSDPDRERWRFYLGAGLSLWVTWQVSTVVGIVIGNAVPPEWHLEFAVPLAFLVLLVPTLVRRPAVVAAGVGGLTAVLAAELGAGPSSIVVGSVAGIVAGALVDSDDPAGIDPARVDPGRGDLPDGGPDGASEQRGPDDGPSDGAPGAGR